MFAQRLVQRAQRQVVRQAQRKFGADAHHNTPSGLSNSPHYADFGYAPHQMLPPHEFMRFPVRPEAKSMPHYYKYFVGFSQKTTGGTLQHPPTGLHLSYQTEFTDQFTNKILNSFVQRGLGLKIYGSLLLLAFSYEAYMHGGYRGPTDSVYENLAKMHRYNGAHALQWEKSWDEFRELPLDEVERVIANRPFYRKNPYVITKLEEEMAARKNGQQGPIAKELEGQKLAYAFTKAFDEHDFLAVWKTLSEDKREILAPVFFSVYLSYQDKIYAVLEELKDLECPEVEKAIQDHQVVINREKSEKYARSLKFIEAKLEIQ